MQPPSDLLAIELPVGQSINLRGLTIAYTPANMVGYVWSSSQPGIAEVTQDGRVTAIAEGVAEIVAARASDNARMSIRIIVIPEPDIYVQSLTFAVTDFTILAGNSILLPQGIIYPANATNLTLNWSDTNTDVAGVVGNRISAGFPGTTEIIVTANGSAPGNPVYVVLTINVINPIVSVNLELYPDANRTAPFDIGDEIDFHYAVNFQVPAWAPDADVELHFYDDYGNLSTAISYGIAVAAGRVHAIARTPCGAESNVVIFTIRGALPTAIDIISARNYVYVDRTLQLAVDPQVDVVWTWAGTGAVSIDSNGLVTGIADGTVTITATLVGDPGVYDTITITVRPLQDYTIAAWFAAPRGSMFDVQTELPLRATPIIGASHGRTIGGTINQLALGQWLTLERYLYVEVDTTGLSNISVSSLQSAGSPDLNSFVLEYSIDGGLTWLDAKPITVCTRPLNDPNLAGVVNNHELPANAGDVSSLLIRWSNTAIGGGNMLIRNIVITGKGPGGLG